MYCVDKFGRRSRKFLIKKVDWQVKLVLCFLSILFFSGSCFCVQTTSHLQEPAEKTERVSEEIPQGHTSIYSETFPFQIYLHAPNFFKATQEMQKFGYWAVYAGADALRDSSSGKVIETVRFAVPEMPDLSGSMKVDARSSADKKHCIVKLGKPLFDAAHEG